MDRKEKSVISLTKKLTLDLDLARGFKAHACRNNEFVTT